MTSQTNLFGITEPDLDDSSDRDTPQWLFDQLDREFNFVLDACADDRNHKCEIYFTKEDDGLAQDWYPYKRIWMNPPYDTKQLRGTISKWMAKAHAEARRRCVVVCLVPVSTSTPWWNDYAVRGRIRYIRGRLKFGGMDATAPFSSAIVIFSTWHLLVRSALERIGGRAHVGEIYETLLGMVEVTTNRHVRAKVRQVLQRYGFTPHGRGVWST